MPQGRGGGLAGQHQESAAISSRAVSEFGTEFIGCCGFAGAKRLSAVVLQVWMGMRV